MLVPCEIAVKCVLPSVRAMIAKELTTKYNLKQSDVAKLLGVSQPAISLYYRKIRGKAIDLEKDFDVTKSIGKLATALVTGNLPHKDFISMFCEICGTIRAKGLMCKMHKTFDPSIDIEKCAFCAAINQFRACGHPSQQSVTSRHAFETPGPNHVPHDILGLKKNQKKMRKIQ